MPVGEVSELVLAGPVGLTTPALHEAARARHPDRLDEFRLLVPRDTGGRGPRSAGVRRAQYEAAGDSAVRLALRPRPGGPKIRNQRTILRRNWRGGGTDPRDAVMERLQTSCGASDACGGPGEPARQ